MRVIVYARYSSDLQRDASIADRFRSCPDYAALRQWTIVEELSDAAMSGSTMFRPGTQALLRAVKDGRCEIVLCEGIDRLSRDLADTAAIFKQLRYSIQVVTRPSAKATKKSWPSCAGNIPPARLVLAKSSRALNAASGRS
jgi:hypothetical protein